MKNYILTLFLFITPFNNGVLQSSLNKDYNNSISYNKEKSDDCRLYNKNNYNKTFNELIEYIKKHEGLRLSPYYCLGNYKTIGYGHVLQARDSLLKFPITEAMAENILLNDLKNSINFVKKETNLSGDKLYAISHFVFCLGSGTFKKSILYKKIKNNEPIDDEIIKFIHIKKKDKSVIKSNYLLKMRRYELCLYKGN